ncbi:hypothetical protein OH76DRAFT_789492 [Lentinus brumalis]|uniref:Uncharacterized protein n=1 Tax=Lentinus brumalis TaxID=2498619 RepID=A0A371D410_9APHY|nr:hypothetical protein OH76DRAFT_789492 [Polyporus brumalis]
MLGKLLGRVGSNVTQLFLSASRPRAEWLTVQMGLPLSSEPPDLSNPYADWRSLNISACTRLEVIQIPIYFRPAEPGETLSTFAALMLSPGTPYLADDQDIRVLVRSHRSVPAARHHAVASRLRLGGHEGPIPAPQENRSGEPLRVP